MTEPTVTTITEGTCDWALVDRYGELYPHGTKATHRVAGAGEMYDGDYCARHARKAVSWSKKGVEVAY